MTATNSTLVFFLVISLFSFNQFALFDLLGVREEVQFASIIPALVICSVIVFSQLANVVKSRFFLYLATMLIFYASKNIQSSQIYNLVFAVLVAGVIATAPKNFCSALTKAVVVIIFAFSVMGIMQAIIVLIEPTLTEDLALFNDVYLRSSENVFFAPGAYGTTPYPEFRVLGLSDGGLYNVGPFYFTRLRSFLHEPSLVSAYFILPGALSLTFGGRWKTAGITILVFSIFTGASTAYILFPISLGVFFVLKRIKQSNAVAIPVIGFISFCALVYFFIPQFSTNAGELSENYQVQVDPLSSIDSDKLLSHLSRLGFISNALALFLEKPLLGISFDLTAPVGLLAWSAVYGGVIGLFMFYLFLSDMLRLLFQAFHCTYAKGFFEFGPIILIYAIFIQAVAFNDYGFSVGFGLTMTALTYRRLRDISFG